MTTLAERCAAVRLLVLDVDGVLTAGGITYAGDGVELKTFHVRDGSGLKVWTQSGRPAALITGRTSRVVEVRAVELGITPVIQGAAAKLPALQQVLTATGLRPDQAAVIGDDWPDVPLLRHCGLAVAVADACPEVLRAAHFVTQAAGGRGAVRETVELILRCQGEWQALVERLQNERMNAER